MASDRAPGSPNDRRVMDALVQFSFTVQDVLAQVAAQHDLSTTQVRLLGILRDREPAMSDLREHLRLEKSSVTGLVDRAERRGLVTRTSGHSDGRAVHVLLTSSGSELATRFAGDVYAELGTLLAPLPAADRGRLLELVGGMLATQGSPFTGQP